MSFYFQGSSAQWSCAGFNQFRQKLATSAGFELSSMAGFGGSTRWDKLSDAITPLIAGIDLKSSMGLSVSEMRKLIPRLRQLIRKWAPEDFDKQQARQLARDMARLVQTNTPLRLVI